MSLPDLHQAKLLSTNGRRLYIAAYGFEQRSTGWAKSQASSPILNEAYVINYTPTKGLNKVDELRIELNRLGIDYPHEIEFDLTEPDKLESTLEKEFRSINEFEEVIVDVTAMTKYLILVCLCKLQHFSGTLRIVYSEAESYSPSLNEYQKASTDSKSLAYFPSHGFKNILRAKCLSSIRMQGQPVAVVAFTSFNEQLVRHMLGTISPYRLIFINGKCPDVNLRWRDLAIQEIHRKLIEDYRSSNPLNEETGMLLRQASTLKYTETLRELEAIHKEFGNYERIIVAATGSKMQTIGLFFAKMKYPDIHIEYPTPDSYFFDGLSKGVRAVHEVVLPSFSNWVR